MDITLSKLIKRLVLAWDPDYTKITPAGATELEQDCAGYERGETVNLKEF
ncbi:MAG: hypothetical protein LBV07_00850 [Syntrophobacterales bacterium]|nr:hypothetical protein [Syntrophobacterales bacterium]